MAKHKPDTQTGYIQQTLSQSRKPIGIFIGAGCPLAVRVPHHANIKTQEEFSEPLIPDVAGLTLTIAKGLDKTPEIASNYHKLLEQVKEEGISEPNIEDVLSWLRALRQVVGKENVREFTAKDLDELDGAICEIICSIVNVNLPSDDTPYHDLAIWIRSIPRNKPVHIFTTNYDLLVEQALEESYCPYFDGFTGSKNAFFDLAAIEDDKFLHSRWCRLWKIHGSINWKIDKHRKVVRSDKISDDESYLIYPSHLKYDQSRKMPYLAMLDRLKQFIVSQPAVLFISGYSFSDEHINDVIVEGLQNNPTSMTFAFLYGELDDPKYMKAIECAKKTSNLTLIGNDKGVIGRRTEDWLINNDDATDPVSETDAEATSKTANQQNNIFELGDFAKFGELLRDMSVEQTPDNQIDA